MNSRLLTIPVFLFFLLSRSAGGFCEDFGPNLPEPLDYQSILPPYYYTSIYSFQIAWEKSSPNRYLFLGDYPSWIRGRTENLAPAIMWRRNGSEMVGGSQLLNRALPFYDRLVITGARCSLYLEKFYLTAWAGNLENLDREIGLGITGSTHAVQGTALRYKSGPSTIWGLGWMSYQALMYAGQTGSVLSLSNASSIGDNLNLSVSLGLDTGTPQGDEKSRDRKACLLTLDYLRGKLSLHGDIQSRGKKFGPPQELSENRGQHNTNAILLYPFNRKLTLDASYRNLESESLVPGVFYSIRTRYFSPRLIYFPSRPVRLQGGIENSVQETLGFGASLLDSTASFFEVLAQAGKWTISGDLRREIRRYGQFPAGDSNDQFRARISVPLSRYFSLTLQQGLFSLYSDSQGTAASSNTSFQCGWTFPEELGYLNAGYAFQNNTAAIGAAVPPAKTYYLNMKWRVLPRLILEGNLSGSDSVGTEYFFPACTLRYLMDETDDLFLRYQMHPPGNTIIVDGSTRELGDQVFLSWRHSLGGSLNGEMKEILKGRLEARVTDAASSCGGRKPCGIAGIPLVLDGKHRLSTDSSGRVRFTGVSPGKHTVSVDLRRMEDKFELLESRDKIVNVSPGRTGRVDFQARGYGSIYAVAWNDADGNGRMKSTYIPVPSVSLILHGPGEEFRTVVTDENGSFSFKRLKVGRYRIAADEKTFAPGMKSTTPLEKVLELTAGQEQVVTFGLQGKGSLRGELMVVEKGSDDRRLPLSRTMVLVDNKPAAETDERGFFTMELPAGSHRIEADPATGGGNMYLAEPSNPVLNVVPSAETEATLVYAYLGRISGEFRERKPDGSRPELKLSGLVVYFSGSPSFVYSDAAGRFRFDRLRTGSCRVWVEPENLPSGYRLVSPPSVEFRLRSGEKKEIFFDLEKKRDKPGV